MCTWNRRRRAAALLSILVAAAACANPVSDASPTESLSPLSEAIGTQPSSAVAEPDSELETSGTSGGPASSASQVDGVTTWNPPEDGYETAALVRDDGFEVAVAVADLIAVVDVVEVGAPYWNSDDNQWWWVSVHDSGDGVPVPILGRDVIVRIVDVVGVTTPLLGDGSPPAVGSELVIFVPGGRATIEVSPDLAEKIRADTASTGGEGHGDSEPAGGDPITQLTYERVPSMALTEGARSLIFVMESKVLWKGGGEVPVLIAPAGPVYSSWDIDLSRGEFLNPVSGERIAAADMAARLDSAAALFPGQMDTQGLRELLGS